LLYQLSERPAGEEKDPNPHLGKPNSLQNSALFVSQEDQVLIKRKEFLFKEKFFFLQRILTSVMKLIL